MLSFFVVTLICLLCFHCYSLFCFFFSICFLSHLFFFYFFRQKLAQVGTTCFLFFFLSLVSFFFFFFVVCSVFSRLLLYRSKFQLLSFPCWKNGDVVVEKFVAALSESFRSPVFCTLWNGSFNVPRNIYGRYKMF